MNWKRILGFFLIIISGFLGWTNFIFTGAVTGTNSLSGLLIVLIFIAGLVLVLTAGKEAEGELERKLKQIGSVKLRRELLSDAHRAEKFAEKGLDVNGLWDNNKSYDENKKIFFEHFYDNVDDEIFVSYWKAFHRGKGIEFDNFKNNRENYIQGEKYKSFKEKALNMIILWNEKILSGEIVPLYTEPCNKEVKDFPGTKHRMVYYGNPSLKGKSIRFYTRTGRKSGEIIAAHEIINPEALENPEKLNRTPHIHWELEYINGMKGKKN